MKKNIVYFLSCLVLIVGLAACSDDDKAPLSPLTVAIEGTEAQEVVQGATLSLKAVVEGSTEVEYVWTLNGKQVSTTSTYDFTATDLGDSEILLTISNAEQGDASAKLSLHVYGKYKYGTFILNEGSAWGGDKGGFMVFISPEGEVVDKAFQTENGGAWLGGVPQDLFIANNKLYIVAQNGGNEGGYLTVVNAETLKLEKAFGNELEDKVNGPTHVAVLSDDNVYLRDNAGISLLHPSTGEVAFIEGTAGARKNTMAVAQGKVFASQSKNLLVIEAGKNKVSATVEFDSNISGVVKSSDDNIWVSVSSGKIAKVNAKDYSIIKENDLAANAADAAKTLVASFAAAPSITAKGDTLYMSALSTKIYRHIFSTNETKLMVDAKDMVENANIVYNTVAVEPVTGDVYFNTIKGYSDVNVNQISVFDFSGDAPVLKAAYNDHTKYPAGVFFTSWFN